MVSGAFFEVVLLAQLLLAQVALLSQVERGKVPEPTRTIVLMALLGILLVGMMLIVATMLGANWVRKQGELRRSRVVPSDVIPPRTPQGALPTVDQSSASSADTFVGDETVKNDDTIVSCNVPPPRPLVQNDGGEGLGEGDLR